VDTTVEQRVLAQLNEREIIDLAGELIRIPSFSPDETPVARFLATYFEQRGYDVDLQEVEPGRFQTIATLREAGGGRRLMVIDEMVQAAQVLALTALDFCVVRG
jgi:acetylornithine deacetylase